MNPNFISAFALIENLKYLGVQRAVISPGSRSTPLAFAAKSKLDTTIVIDERDAGFIALGNSIASSKPTILITTSGSAPTHLFPSVVEAQASNVPLIILTADRPFEVRGRGAPQTIDQHQLFGNAVRLFIDSIPPKEASMQYWTETAVQLFDRATNYYGHPGPVHLNIGFDENLVPDGDEDLSEEFLSEIENARIVTSVQAQYSSTSSEVFENFNQELLNEILNSNKTLVTIGRNSGLSRFDVANFGINLKLPVLADPISGCRFGETISNYDFALRNEENRDLIPDVVLQFGDPLTSKLFNNKISKSKVFSFRKYNDGRDPYGHAIQTFVNEKLNVYLEKLTTHPFASNHDFFLNWQLAERRVNDSLEKVFAENTESEPAVFRKLGQVLKETNQALDVFVGSSMPVRYAEWFWSEIPENVNVFSNRGTNGIDGAIATSFGIAQAEGDEILAVLGDVTFTHNIGFMASISNLAKKHEVKLVIALIDNSGGAIFRHLEQAKNGELSSSYEDLFQTKPRVDFQRLCKSLEVNYFTGSIEQGIDSVRSHIEFNDIGVSVIHFKVEHDSGPIFMKNLQNY